LRFSAFFARVIDWKDPVGQGSDRLSWNPARHRIDAVSDDRCGGEASTAQLLQLKLNLGTYAVKLGFG
jgi:hypothetical protein